VNYPEKDTDKVDKDKKPVTWSFKVCWRTMSYHPW